MTYAVPTIMAVEKTNHSATARSANVTTTNAINAFDLVTKVPLPPSIENVMILVTPPIALMLQDLSPSAIGQGTFQGLLISQPFLQLLQGQISKHSSTKPTILRQNLSRWF